ncbi:aldehyde dehydrogenase (NADP(+)), partial [Streptomyces anulatus]|nr:aldehyde dehydrogenase (NADP(+)) [Streptomyces anulatus]
MNPTGNPAPPADSHPTGPTPLTEPTPLSGPTPLTGHSLLSGHSLLAGREVPGTGDAWYAVAAATGEPFGPPHRDASAEQVAEAARL